MVTVIGGSLTAWVEQAGGGMEETADGSQVRRTYIGISNLTNSFSFGDADGTYTQCFVRAIRREQKPSRDYVTMEVIFKPASYVDFGAPTPAAGTVTLSANSNVIQEPISNHPTMTAEQKTDALAKGVESYLIPQPEFTREEVLNSFVFSQTNVILNVGKICAPTSMTGPSTNKWLKTVLAVRQTGIKFVKSETWQFSDTGWSTNIYVTA